MNNRVFDVSRLETTMMKFGAVQAVAVQHQLTHWVNKRMPAHAESDRGAVSLEQVLWFAAAGVASAVVAGVLWNTVMGEAKKSEPSLMTVPTGVKSDG